MKKLFYISILLLSACGSKSRIITNTIHDTVRVDAEIKTIMDSTVEPLLITYFKAGWMQAQNGLIDLHNAGKFNDREVEKLRWNEWAKMESEIKNK